MFGITEYNLLLYAHNGPKVGEMNQVVPQFRQLSNSHDLYFQQDRVPAHYSRAIQEYLDETFPEKWIG